MRKQQLQTELAEAKVRIVELETKVWIYEGVLSAGGFKKCIKGDVKKKPEMGFVAKGKK